MPLVGERKLSEQKLQTAIIHYLRTKGAYVVKTMTVSKAGVPDILACYQGHFVAIEVKAGSKLTELQKVNIKQINESGGIAFVAYSIKDVKENLG